MFWCLKNSTFPWLHCSVWRYEWGGTERKHEGAWKCKRHLWDDRHSLSLTWVSNECIDRHATKHAFNSRGLIPVCISHGYLTTSLSTFIYILLYLQSGLAGGRTLLNIFYQRNVRLKIQKLGVLSVPRGPVRAWNRVARSWWCPATCKASFRFKHLHHDCAQAEL